MLTILTYKPFLTSNIFRLPKGRQDVFFRFAEKHFRKWNNNPATLSGKFVVKA